MAFDWIKRAEDHALENHDGHLTIFRFTTGWKAVFNTIDVYGGDRGRLHGIEHAETAALACRDLLLREGIVELWDSYRLEDDDPIPPAPQGNR